MSTSSLPAPTDSVYFEFQAAMGLTKHIGGASASEALVRFCHIEPGQHLLDVGCGVGVTARWLAEHHQVTVTGVDLRASMVERAFETARQSQASSQLRFETADAQSLPFESESFDVVLCESVLTFVNDRMAALQEFMRVVKPGGWVGYTESFWAAPPTPEMAAFFRTVEPTMRLETSGYWTELLESSGLTETVVHVIEATNPMNEARDQLRNTGWGRTLRAWGRTMRLMMSPRYRAFIFGAGRHANKSMKTLGYGVFAGRKPEA
jgi:ubiquinone/menaquinone biosynthesis C-methylase UbiE